MRTISRTSLTIAALPGAALAAFLLATPGCNNDLSAVECPNGNETVGATTGGGGDSSSSGNANTSTTTSTGSGTPMDFTPQEVAAKLHGCRKLRHETLGNVLRERGVDTETFLGSGNNCQTDANGPFCPAGERCYCSNPPCLQTGNDPGNQGTCVIAPESPGFLYSTAEDAFSVPKMDSRRGEKDGHTTASAMRLFDIFIQAAPQIIANIDNPTLAPACVLNGMTHPMFDPVDGSCVEESISCLLGTPATEDHVVLCNLILDKADPLDNADIVRKQHIAVASMLAAAHSCE
jgi:hypothetical protein